MKTFKFKTDIQNEQRMALLANYLDSEESIAEWNLDINSPDHILTILGTAVDPQQIESKAKEAGLRAEMVQVYGSAGEGM